MTGREIALMAIPAGVSAAGGVLAALVHPSPRARSLIQHFAAGVVLSALAVELLPEIEREHAPGWVLATSFGVGCAFMFGMKMLTERIEKRDEQRHGSGASGHAQKAGGVALGLLVATFIDVAVDGFIIGAGFAAPGSTGKILAIGLSVELLFLGLSLTSEAPGGWRIIAISSALGVVVMVTAMIGKALLGNASHATIGGALAFAAAALLYLVTEELLVEAHKEPETPASTLVLFAGFLAFWCVQLFGA